MNKFFGTFKKNMPSISQLRFHIQEPGCNSYDFHYHLTECSEYVIGRVANQYGADVVQIQLLDMQVSRNHCRIFLNPKNIWMIEDLGSANGTYIRLPEGREDGWQKIHYATPIPSTIDLRVGTSMLTIRPMHQDLHPNMKLLNFWQRLSKRAA